MAERRVQPVVGASLVLWHSDLDQVVAAARSLAAQVHRVDHLVLVVNDDGDGNEGRRAERLLTAVLDDIQLTIRSLSYNSGFAGGHDLALDVLFSGGCDHALVLNPDVVLDPACVAVLVTHVQAQSSPVLAGPLLERAAANLAGEGTIDTAGIRWTVGGRHLDALQGREIAAAPHSPVRVRGISGAAMFVTRAAYQRLLDASGEFFDTDFIAYREDAELALRAELLGIECWLVPHARGLHVRSVRGTSRNTTPWINALGVRNRFLIAAKYGLRRPGIWPLPWLRDMVVVSAVVVREHQSRPALREAWRLRHRMREKGHTVRRAHQGLAR